MSSRVDSFRQAGAGVAATVATQANARIQLAAAVAVVALGATLDLSRGDWCWLVAAIAAVFAAECMNTALESLADATHPDPHPLVGRAKDAAAGAVLCTAVGAALIGVLVLGRPLLALWASR
ncbi:MAG: diacylglycerol kinase family protein [Myxococcota bacterium]